MEDQTQTTLMEYILFFNQKAPNLDSLLVVDPNATGQAGGGGGAAGGSKPTAQSPEWKSSELLDSLVGGLDHVLKDLVTGYDAHMAEAARDPAIKVFERQPFEFALQVLSHLEMLTRSETSHPLFFPTSSPHFPLLPPLFTALSCFRLVPSLYSLQFPYFPSG